MLPRRCLNYPLTTVVLDVAFVSTANVQVVTIPPPLNGTILGAGRSGSRDKTLLHQCMSKGANRECPTL